MLLTDISVHIALPENLDALRNQAPTEISTDLEQFTLSVNTLWRFHISMIKISVSSAQLKHSPAQFPAAKGSSEVCNSSTDQADLNRQTQEAQSI